ncbi:TRAP transporter substrate-binding protein [Variovorax dokdonensis]|uniref:TRAP transporter substrate-binding protein n=1 Tax=Variovorax dokdonensis TaxID=344883 RepID=A0ABT7NAV2_9BURK|nr:TRAP transporter substrate-binding protein [Variovorax dokdonensis]MDM0045048.1 TRAP transporter substrate-binding protein [Variovorax dokdonensis]
MSITRRSLVKVAAASTLGVALPARFAMAQQAEFTYKYGNNLPPAHPLNIRTKEMAEKVKAETNGRVDIQVFPASQLGSDTDMLSQLRAGGIEFMTLSGLILATLVPHAAISGIGFAFSDYPTVWKAMDGDLGAYIRGQIGKANLVAMDRIFDNGFRQVTSGTRQIKSPDDLKGFKIRVPVSPLWTSMFKSFDAAPVGINASELYTALQTRVVDGQENALTGVMALKMYEVQKFCALTNHMWDGFWFLGNRRAWERLPTNLREIVARNINAAALAERTDLAEQAESMQKELASKGMTFSAPKPDAFREKLRAGGFYAEWKGKLGDEAWGLLERSAGKLG